LSVHLVTAAAITSALGIASIQPNLKKLGIVKVDFIRVRVQNLNTGDFMSVQIKDQNGFELELFEEEGDGMFIEFPITLQHRNLILDVTITFLGSVVADLTVQAEVWGTKI